MIESGWKVHDKTMRQEANNERQDSGRLCQQVRRHERNSREDRPGAEGRGLRRRRAARRRVAAIAPYRAVVLGSAVYIGGWRKAAVRFLKANEKALAQRPVWLFSSGPTGQGDPVELVKGWRFPKALQHIADRVRPREIVIFQGAVFAEKLSAIGRWMMTQRQGAGRRLPRLGRHQRLGEGHRRRPYGEGVEIGLGEWTCPGACCIITPFLKQRTHFLKPWYDHDWIM